MNDKIEKNVTFLNMFFTVLFTVCLLMSNILASKLIRIGYWSITAGVIVFPISYIINDIVAEVYGFRMARRIIWIGFIMNIFMVAIFSLAIVLPSPVWYEGSIAFATALGSTPRIVVAGLLAYLLGSWANAAIISKLKTRSRNGEKFGFRAILSTLIGESIDSLIFIPLVFIGSVPFTEMIPMIILQIVFKTSYECLILPLTAVIVKKVKRYENIDVFDDNISYGLFGAKHRNSK
jgi:uncharacterized integral membrane protein (TIGR00697 family)